MRRGFSPGRARSAAVLSFNHDGLEIARVKTTRRRWLPLWHIVVVVYLVLLVRMVAVADIGPAGYANRIEEMRNGNALERISARIMALDPVSRKFAGHLRSGIDAITPK